MTVAQALARARDGLAIEDLDTISERLVVTASDEAEAQARVADVRPDVRKIALLACARLGLLDELRRAMTSLDFRTVHDAVWAADFADVAASVRPELAGVVARVGLPGWLRRHATDLL